MPHQTFAQLIRRRLTGKDGIARVRELEAILAELPNYKNGPYADLRKWVQGELDRTRMRRRVVHRDTIAIRREGPAQVALVGPPNAGKSSLLQALSDVQIKTGDYAFTTTRPVAATTRVEGVPVQLVEIPGLLRGAHEDRGGGRALLGVLRGADAIVFCHPVTAPPTALTDIRAEVAAAGIERPALVAATKWDEPAAAELDSLAAVSGLPVVAVSVLDDASLDRFRAAVFALTGLIRVTPRGHDGTPGDVVALRPPATVADLAGAIHGALARRCAGARIWGPSARFAGQRVGRDHRLLDGDEAEIVDPSRR